MLVQRFPGTVDQNACGWNRGQQAAMVIRDVWPRCKASCEGGYDHGAGKDWARLSRFCGRTRGPQRYRRVGDRRTAAEDMTIEAVVPMQFLRRWTIPFASWLILVIPRACRATRLRSPQDTGPAKPINTGTIVPSAAGSRSPESPRLPAEPLRRPGATVRSARRRATRARLPCSYH